MSCGKSIFVRSLVKIGKKMDDDLVKLLKYELGDSPSIEQKAERLAQ